MAFQPQCSLTYYEYPPSIGSKGRVSTECHRMMIEKGQARKANDYQPRTFLDSGARPHFFNAIEAFSQIVRIEPYPIEVANGHTETAHYAGLVKLVCPDPEGQRVETLDWCILAPSFSDNLVSTSTLDTHYGARTCTQDQQCTVEVPADDGGWRVMLEAHLQGHGFYEVAAAPIPKRVEVGTPTEPPEKKFSLLTAFPYKDVGGDARKSAHQRVECMAGCGLCSTRFKDESREAPTGVGHRAEAWWREVEAEGGAAVVTLAGFFAQQRPDLVPPSRLPFSPRAS